MAAEGPRNYPRFALDAPVRAAVDSVFPRFEFNGRVRDLGGGGLGAWLTGEIPEGTPVTLEVFFRWGSLRLPGVVVWKRPLDGDVLHGFRFDVPIGNGHARELFEEVTGGSI